VYKKPEKQKVSRGELVKTVALMSNGLDGGGKYILKLSSGQVRCHLSLLLPLGQGNAQRSKVNVISTTL
jgi:hypothetical protein